MCYRIATALVAGFLATISPAALAQDISGEIRLNSSYIDDDSFNYSAKDGEAFGPALQTELDVNFGSCGLYFSGYKTLGSRRGDEFDSEIYCSIAFSEQTEVSVTIGHYALAGEDMFAFEGGLTHKLSLGIVDLTISRYTWKNNQDATRLQVGFTPDFSQDFDLRLYATHEQGLDMPNITTIALSGAYPLSEHFSLTANIVGPVIKADDDERETVFAIGIRYSF